MPKRTHISTDRRGFVIAAAALLGSGCFGSFGATNALYDWNAGVSSNKWIRWLVFLVLIILPVYGLFMLADAIVLNTIEFFTGKNPIDGHADLGHGYSLRSRATDDPNLVKHEVWKDGSLARTIYVRKLDEDTLQLLDEHMRPAGTARLLGDGSVEVLDGNGRVLTRVARDQVQRATAALDRGSRPSEAVAEAMRQTQDQTALAQR